MQHLVESLDFGQPKIVFSAYLSYQNGYATSQKWGGTVSPHLNWTKNWGEFVKARRHLGAAFHICFVNGVHRDPPWVALKSNGVQ